MTDFPVELHRFSGFDGADLACHVMGEGRAVVLIHGYFSDAATNWIKYGHAAAIAARGFRLYMPDLRAHGGSAKPHDAAAYPPDALAMDAEGMIAQFGLTDYDLGGYSLGARTTARMLARGATPRRVIFSGMGLAGLLETGRRVDFFRRVLTGMGSHARGTPEFLAEAFLKTTGGDPVALLHILGTFVDTPREVLANLAQRALVVCGSEDDDNGSASSLAALLPQGKLVETPGNHMSAVVRAELGQAIADFVSA